MQNGIPGAFIPNPLESTSFSEDIDGRFSGTARNICLQISIQIIMITLGEWLLVFYGDALTRNLVLIFFCRLFWLDKSALNLLRQLTLVLSETVALWVGFNGLVRVARKIALWEVLVCSYSHCFVNDSLITVLVHHVSETLRDSHSDLLILLFRVFFN